MSSPGQCVLVLPPTRRDGEVTLALLAQAGIEGVVCATPAELCEHMAQGVGVVMLTEAALCDPAIGELVAALALQPPWSDLPVVVLARDRQPPAVVAHVLERLGNVTLLDRPVSARSMLSAVGSALRARTRQYQIRDHLLLQERTEAALRESDRRKDEFLAMLAHELRNPLAPIANAVRLLDKDLTPERHRTVVEMVRRQSAHMARLVDDLLEVSRVTQGRIELRKERLLLAHALLPALEAARLIASQQGQSLIFDVPPDLQLEADPARLTQIVGNLLTNAVKYTPAGGHVRVSARMLECWVEIEVQDDGLGLDEALLPRVFDLFAQGATTLDRSRGGLGLGLTLVRRLAELHGGDAEASSLGPGLGSTFTVRLPRLQGTEASGTAVMSATSPRLAPTTVLVVDDNADAADSLALLLQLNGHEVRVARSGPEGLDVARQWQPRALLLDLGLPGLDGYAVARMLRQEPATAGMAIVAVSGYGQESDREKTRAAGFDAHLVKPVDLEEAYRVLAQALASSN